MKKAKETIKAKGLEISIYTEDFENNIARFKNASKPKNILENWLRSSDTIEFIELWEQLNNPNFKGVEFDTFKNQAGSNAFTLSPQKWVETKPFQSLKLL